ncbi:hypothetical protein BH18ACT4_BH18ACT4_06600 [soil metagenome]
MYNRGPVTGGVLAVTGFASVPLMLFAIALLVIGFGLVRYSAVRRTASRIW